MNRKEFLKLISFSLAVGTLGIGLKSCSENSTSPTNVDFTIDLTNPEFSALNQPNGFIVYNEILIINTGNNNFIALAGKCTHEGYKLVFDELERKVICNKHSSEFDLDGKVLKSPAKKNLQKYNIEKNGNLLRIFS